MEINEKKSYRFSSLLLSLLRSNLIRRIIAFTIVGGIGFLIDGGIVSLLVEIIKLNPFISRAISFPVAVVKIH